MTREEVEGMNLIVVFLQKAIAQGIAILYGANGEIRDRKIAAT